VNPDHVASIASAVQSVQVTGPNQIDLAVLVLVGVGALRGAFVGLVKELATAAWIVLGTSLGFVFSGPLGDVYARFLGQGVHCRVLGFITILVLSCILVHIIEASISAIFEGAGLRGLDRGLGFLLGALEGACLAAVLFLLLEHQSFWNIKAQLDASVTAKLLVPFAPMVDEFFRAQGIPAGKGGH